MRRMLLLFLCFFAAVTVSSQEARIQISISELEQYLDKPVPESAERIDIRNWSIQLFDNDLVMESINLATDNDLVRYAEYSFVQKTGGGSTKIRGNLIDVFERYGRNRRENKNVGTLIWELFPDSELGNEKHLLILLHKIELINAAKDIYELRFGITEYDYMQKRIEDAKN